MTEDWVFRDLRYSFGVNFLKAGGKINELQKIMGHSHVRMTEELYGRYKIQRADFFDLEVVPLKCGRFVRHQHKIKASRAA